MKTKKSNATSTDENTAFEKARFEYCWKIYEEENQRKEILEKKSQFYLSFITLILGAIFLNINFIEILRNMLFQNTSSSIQKWIILLPLITLAFSLAISLIAIFRSLHIKEYTRPYPANTISCYFDPSSDYFEDNTASSVFRVTATDIAIALETNRALNNKKTNWVKISSTGLIMAIISLTIFLTLIIVFYLQ